MTPLHAAPSKGFEPVRFSSRPPTVSTAGTSAEFCGLAEVLDRLEATANNLVFEFTLRLHRRKQTCRV